MFRVAWVVISGAVGRFEEVLSRYWEQCIGPLGCITPSNTCQVTELLLTNTVVHQAFQQLFSEELFNYLESVTVS